MHNDSKKLTKSEVQKGGLGAKKPKR